MAHGRKRWFMGGALIGALGMAVLGAAGAWVFRGSIHDFEHSRFEQNAMSATSYWGRIPPLPKDAKGVAYKTEGSMFTRSFRISFFGEPQEVRKWVKSCPGVSDPKCMKKLEEDGSELFMYPGSGGAMGAEIRHYPDRGIVEIYTFWS